MSRFIDEPLCTVRVLGTHEGIVAGKPTQPARWTWAEVHDWARVMAGALIGAGVHHGSVVGVLADAPVLIAIAAQAAWLPGGRHWSITASSPGA
jgi:fatty-acyl-CoA synthase